MGRSAPAAVVRVTIAVVIAGLSALSGQAQNVTTLSGLGFGSVLSGTTTSVAPTAVGAMSFDIHGASGVISAWSFTLPTVLTRVGGGATMPITFCSTCGRYRVSNNNPAGGIVFNPANPMVGLSIAATLHVYVWVGASISPPLNQMPGSYTGTVVLTIAPLI